jgi:hypothetical protein
VTTIDSACGEATPNTKHQPSTCSAAATLGAVSCAKGACTAPVPIACGVGTPADDQRHRCMPANTCHSGNAYNQTLGNAAYHANIIAYTAARFDQEALENAKGGLAVKKQISTRSRRALLTHRAPPSGHGVETVQRQRV